MTSTSTLIVLLLLIFITLAASQKKMKSVDKIILHVPYKIHKHHHTHTNYKVITIPAPKHENTIIYLKEEQKDIKPQVQHLAESNFMPPHQESAASLLQHLENYKANEPEEQQLIQATTQQKSLEPENQNFVPNYEFQSVITPTHENVIPQFLFRPVLMPQQEMFSPKFIVDPAFHQHNFIPNFHYSTMLQSPAEQFIHKYAIKHALPSRIQDNVAHSSSHAYKMAMTRQPKSESYKVREEVQEDHNGQLHRNQHEITKIIVPSLKSNEKRKTYVHSGQKYNRSIMKKVPIDPNYEYEHVGYLVIDGNSRKIVGRNFENVIHLR